LSIKWSRNKPFIITLKLIAPKIEAAPERCKLKILGIDEFLINIKTNNFNIIFGKPHHRSQLAPFGALSS
jgi:hypothetical protein